MTVIYIRPSSSKGYLRIGVESEEKKEYTLSESEYAALGSPLVGDNLTRDTVSDLKLADMRYRAKKKALNVLSFGDNSEKMLIYKLTSAGISREISEEVTREMVARGYINSRRQLEALIINEVNSKLHGPGKIIPRLIAKGYNKSEISEVISELEYSGKIDFDSARKRLLARLPEDADGEDVKKLLYKNGYSVG